MVQKIEILNSWQGFKNRFNADGECRSSSIDFIGFFLKNISFDKKEIQTTYDTLDTISFLNRNKFNFLINLPLISFFSKKGFHLYRKYRQNIILGDINIHLQKLNEKKYCVLYHQTAYQFYRLLGQNWSHCLVLASLNNEIFIYDPLYEILINDGEEVKTNTVSEINRINNLLGIRIIIW